MPDHPAELRSRATLGLVESLFAMLVEKRIITPAESAEVFEVAINAFRHAGDGRENNEDNEAVAKLLERVQAEGDGVTYR